MIIVFKIAILAYYFFFMIIGYLTLDLLEKKWLIVIEISTNNIRFLNKQ